MTNPIERALADAAEAAPANPTSNPDITDRLLRCKSDEERIAVLDRHIAALEDAVREKTEKARQAYLDSNASRYSDVDPVRALTGAPVLHSIVVAKAAAYRVRPPVGKTSHAVDRFVQEAGDLGPVTQEEAILLAWLCEVQLLARDGGEDQPAQDLTRADLPSRLSLLRQLPSMLQSKIADECIGLQTWLSVYLDTHLGNS